MRIVKSEVIYLSENESRAFAEVARVLEGVIREGENSSNVMKAKCLLDHMERFLNGCDDDFVEQECDEETLKIFLLGRCETP